jgi:hypothetical protein
MPKTSVFAKVRCSVNLMDIFAASSGKAQRVIGFARLAAVSSAQHHGVLGRRSEQSPSKTLGATDSPVAPLATREAC